MTRFGVLLEDAARRFRSLPAPARRWLSILSVPALAVGLLVGTLLGPGVLGATGLPTVISMPFASDGGSADAGPEIVAGAGNAPGSSAPSLSPPTGNVAAPAPAPAPVTAGPSSAPAPIPSSSPQPTPSPDPGPNPTRTPSQPPADPGPGGPPPNETLAGTVVRVNPEAHSYALADGKSPLVAVHAPKLPEVGRTISVEGRELNNGTYAEAGERKLTGRSRSAGFSGTVTFSDGGAGVYAVSSRGTSVLVHLPTPPAPAPAPAAPAARASAPLALLLRALRATADSTPPAVGSQVTVTVSLNPVEKVAAGDPQAAPPAPAPPVGDQAQVPVPAAPVAPSLCREPAGAAPPEPPPQPDFTLVEAKRKVADEVLGYSNLEGLVQAVCHSPSELVISADDVREAGVDLRVAIPKGLDLSAVKPGSAVDATVLIDEKTGALELAGLSSDDGASGANDAGAALGDQAGG